MCLGVHWANLVKWILMCTHWLLTGESRAQWNCVLVYMNPYDVHSEMCLYWHLISFGNLNMMKNVPLNQNKKLHVLLYMLMSCLLMAWRCRNQVINSNGVDLVCHRHRLRKTRILMKGQRKGLYFVDDNFKKYSSMKSQDLKKKFH